MRSYLTLVAYMMIIYVANGVGIILTTYFSTYFFEFSEREMGGLPIAAGISGLVCFVVAPWLGQKIDKKWTVVLSTLVFGLFFCLPFFLKLVGFYPANISTYSLPLYLILLLIAYTFLWVSFSLCNSMMADVIDEYELLTKKRNEGFFFSTLSFAYKCTVGLGSLIGGVLLDMIQFPKQVSVDEVPFEAIQGLGYIGGPILFVFYMVSLLFILKYPIDKARYKSIRSQIAS